MSEAGTLSVIATRAGGPEVLALVRRELPSLKPGEMRVRVHAAGVNRPDAMQRAGNYPPPPGVTDVLGLELAGEVIETAADVTRFQPGDRVMALVAGGAYAEEAVVQADVCIPVPAGLSMIEAAGIPETYFTVWSNLFQRAGLKAGETVLLHGGTSGIGVTATLLARAVGARMITTCGSDDKCAASIALGASASINYRTQDFVAEGRALTEGRGPEVVVDMVGGSYMQRNLELVAEDGRIAQIAFQQGARADMDMGPLLFKRLTLSGSTLRARPIPMKAALTRAVEAEVIPLIMEKGARPAIDSVFDLTDVQSAHAHLEASAHTGKIILKTAACTEE
ncbi:NAD(P)H-quinone oxidoreductase [Paracoccus sulfuroxidans]|uniref:Putative PIG3 family NAD(P)H quinone oxidoreductase n=1 Tax=Paracoccus sulfuroxidans TaxID=384678 RepID=A0A562NUN7_9RHOB|nr:NAD(P)H-quinone oxidoreductase [Paracoccus sulfuroxidans]TWI35760.1 putative PIG3 family NAD(P)H quinone oxidoreductase [Paracoccus sulfuroxidans]